MNTRIRTLLVLLALLTSLLVACGGDPTPTPDTTSNTGAATATTATEPEASPTAAETAPTAESTEKATDTPAAGSDNDGILVVSNDQQATWVRNFNPFVGDNRWPTQAGIYEPMFVYNIAQSEAVPWLATDWAWNDDYTQLDFTLRDGVKWSDGEDFNAEDVVFTFELMLKNDGLQGNGRPAIRFLEGVSSDSPTTVSFKFKEVSTVSLYDIGQQMIVPEHIWKDVADVLTFTNENPVATGPFTEITVFENQVWQIEKNPNYWQEGKPYIQGIRQPAYPGNDQANLATINGDNDLASNFIPDVNNTYVAQDPENNHYWFPPINAPVMLYLNTTKAPFDDANVRKAISMAFDRSLIASIAFYDYTIPANVTGLTDAFSSWRSEEALAAGDWTTFNVDEANKMLDEAGLVRGPDGIRTLPDGTKMVYDINVVSGWTDWVSTDQIIADSLKEVGIDATTRTYDFSAWFDRVQKGEFDMSMGWSLNGPTPYQFYRGLMSQPRPVGEASGDNWHRYGNDDVEALLQEFASTADDATQKEIMNKIQLIFVQEAPAIPIVPNLFWGEYNTKKFTDFPNEDDPYVLLSSFQQPDRLIMLTTIKPK